MHRPILIVLLALVAFIAAGTPSIAGVNITTPAGIQPGQSFYIVFVDSTSHTATSTLA